MTERKRDQVSPSMTSGFNWRNKHPVPTAILFFKIILGKTLEDGKLKIPNSFTRKYGGGLSNPMYLKPPDGTEWKVDWTKHDGQILLEKGWKEFASYYSLDHGHLVVFEYKETCHFGVHIFDMSGLEIDYPFHGTQVEKDNLDQISREAIEILDEMPLSQNIRLKSPMSSPQPCERLRTGSTGDVRTSYNLRNLPQFDQINGNQSQGTNFEKSTFVSMKKELDEDIGGITRCPKVEQSTKATEALNKATTFRTKRSPSFMLVMKPSYVNNHSLNVPLKFTEKYLKIKQGAAILQVLDGRTWSVIYNLGKFNSGWKRFASDNNLNVGDVCVFELTNRKGLSFKVLISRAAQEPSCPLSQVQGDGVNWLDPGRVQYVDSVADFTSKGREATQRTSMVISPHSGTNEALKEAEKFTSENPFFMVNIRPNMLVQSRPHVSAAFVRKYLNNAKQIVTLQHGKKLWRVKLLCYAYKTPCKLSSGWFLFVRGSGLQAGDVCIFELINREAAVFDVHIFRCPC